MLDCLVSYSVQAYASDRNPVQEDSPMVQPWHSWRRVLSLGAVVAMWCNVVRGIVSSRR